MEESGLFFHAKEINSYVIDYLRDKNETSFIGLDVFSEKEEKHLLEVKILIHRTFEFLFLMLVLFFILIYYNYEFNKNENLDKVLLYSGMLTVAILVLLYFIPFELVFTAFHKIFFAQGSWIFPPNSALIQIYPFDFWHSISFSLFSRGFIAGWLLIAAGLLRKYS